MAPTEPTPFTNGLQSYSVSKLAHDGFNWITWKSQALVTLAASHRVMQHIEGTDQPLPTILIFPSNNLFTADEEEQLETAEKCHDNYDQQEAIIKAQIFTSIPY